MPSTVECQKVIVVSKSQTDKNHPYSIINLEALDTAMSCLKNCDFILWMYIAKNQNGYTFALSRTAFCRATGYSKNSYLRAVKSLTDKGYLVQSKEGSNTYTFYELPKENDESQKTEDDLKIKATEEKKKEFIDWQF